MRPRTAAAAVLNRLSPHFVRKFCGDGLATEACNVVLARLLADVETVHALADEHDVALHSYLPWNDEGKSRPCYRKGGGRASRRRSQPHGHGATASAASTASRLCIGGMQDAPVQTHAVASSLP